MAAVINPTEPARWSAQRVQALAPDAASQTAGRKLAVPGPWTGSGARGEAGLVWGDCRGSGAKPYQVTVELPADQGQPAYACTCPSRKFPCKHALGLLLLWSAGTVQEVGADAVPPRVDEWLTSRRERAERGEARKAAQTERAAAADDLAGDSTAVDKANQAAARRAAQRIERIDAGLDDLELWLRDQLRSGLTGLRAGGYRPIDDLARRLVDAQAPGVAGRVKGLTVCLSTAEDWPERTLTELSLLHLLIQGWRHRDALPAPLAATVRRRVGLSMTAGEIAAAGEHVDDRWLVLGSRDLATDKLGERRIWLQALGSGRPAMLLAFAPPGQGFALALPAGAVLDAELAFAPDAAPLRAVVVRQRELSADPGMAAVPQGGTLDDAAAAFAAALAADPWTTAVPVVVDSAVPLVGDRPERWQIADVKGGGRVPLLAQADGVDPNRADLVRHGLLASGGGHPAPLFGLYRNGGLTPITVWSDGQAASL
ncbi:MAG TPA: SWIM zinc finger family protein [Actinocrinis sp.]|uniref:SWIM zinc finger family protein n=1 Tax=Actinocrinis sp. TaxID=1920516 RepID=UPI002DDD4698|nr:SWIM zinc finger family protein [Actinocrinis sp.]HEV2343553.1 SWIM zinc finger family protein [Actinocrinis sp.]